MAISAACCLASPFAYVLPFALLVAFGLVWGASIIADSAQFSAAVTELAEPEAFARSLVAMFGEASMLERAASSVVAAYRLDDERTREGVLQVARSVPLTGEAFGCLRTLFKAAEFRGDGEVFGILARRFETSAPNPGYWNQRVAFVSTTRDYLRRRAARIALHRRLEIAPRVVERALCKMCHAACGKRVGRAGLRPCAPQAAEQSAEERHE